MNLLFITPYYKPAYVYGGPVVSNSALCEALARRGVNVTVLTTNAGGKDDLEGPTGELISRDGVRLYVCRRARIFR
jgi:glycogen synthase